MIHILRHGRAVCGKPGMPGDWQDGDKWIAPTDDELKDPNIANRVSCHDCLRGGPPPVLCGTCQHCDADDCLLGLTYKHPCPSFLLEDLVPTQHITVKPLTETELNKLADAEIAAHNLLTACDDDVAQALTVLAQQISAHNKKPPYKGPTCKYCGGPVDKEGQVHAGGCGNIG
jgi:hypothetical protein